MKKAQELQDRIQGVKNSMEDMDSDGNTSDYSDTDNDDDYDNVEVDILEKGKKAIMKTVGLDDDNNKSNQSIKQKGLFGMKFMQEAAARARENAKNEAGELIDSMSKQEQALRKNKDKKQIDSFIDDADHMWDDNDKDSNSGSDSDPDNNEQSENDADEVDALGNIDEDNTVTGKAAKLLAKRKLKDMKHSNNDNKDSNQGRFKFGGQVNANDNNGNKNNKNKKARTEDNMNSVNTNKNEKSTVQVSIDDQVEVQLHTNKKNNNKNTTTAKEDDKKDTTATTTTSNPWLSQGGVSIYSMSNADKDGTNNPTNVVIGNQDASNPWLQNTFSTGEKSGGRHAASKRASQQTKEHDDMNVHVDVNAALNSIASIVDKHSESTLHKNASKDNTIAKKGKNDTYVAKLPSNTATVATTTTTSTTEEDTTSNKKDNNKNKKSKTSNAIPEDEQAELIRRAFTGYGVTEEDIAQEKEEENQALKEAEEAALSATKKKGDRKMDGMSGWGNWSGLGAEMFNTVEKKKFKPSSTATALQSNVTSKQQQTNDGIKRNDATNSKVIISQKRDRKLASHQVDNIPHPFKSREQYEAFLKQPVGKEWNTMASATDLTKPEWTTRTGTIIQPIAYAKVKRGEGVEVARSASKVASSGQGKSRVR